MKRVMWISAMLPMIVTGIIVQFLPDVIPMHHDLAGNTDRWGNKMESFIFPICIMAITLFWQLLIRFYENKAEKTKIEKAQMEAKLSAKFLCMVGISQAIMFGVMHYFILYSSYVQANAGVTHATIDMAKISCMLCGIVFIILGNFIIKTKRNSAAGVRTSWSMYNDNTWRASNRFGAISIIVAGILTIVTAIIANGMVSTICLIIYIVGAAVAAVLYSRKVYDEEIIKEKE